MRRNVNLIELSRDHHFGLLMGWKIKQGMTRGIAPRDIADYCIYFAEKALFPHFRHEEDQLLVFLDEFDEKRVRTVDEHQKIRSAVAALQTAADKHQLLELARLVEAHIRFEERELFPYMESSLSSEE